MLSLFFLDIEEDSEAGIYFAEQFTISAAGVSANKNVKAL